MATATPSAVLFGATAAAAALAWALPQARTPFLIAAGIAVSSVEAALIALC